ncbi:signal recognition particle-docking protein FtsY [Actinomycetaceae bacterium TAE3-ERU4]|nr:signal recognition particle-docking protein FtsY [Actinomycetaceae bacterium TAE3-ERU4]
MQSFIDFFSQPEAYWILALIPGGLAAYFLKFAKSKKDGSEKEADELSSSASSGFEDTSNADSAAAVGTTKFEEPEALGSRMTRLRARLARSGSLGKTLLSVISRGDLSESDWEEIEETLLGADLGLEATDQIMEALRLEAKVRGLNNPDEVRRILREQLLAQVDPSMNRELNLSPTVSAEGTKIPAAVLMVGVNGVGKTTSAAKLTRILVAEGKSVVLGAADTFRAAAADQLETWADRIGVEVVRSNREGADPASVAFDAVKHAAEVSADVVLVDTAGRLHNKSTLMDELGKIRRVMERVCNISETLLVLDATTGQNGMAQARVFAEVAQVSGIVLTKLDGTAKGGIVVSVQKELGVPVKLVGLGEGADDMAPFNPEAFVESIIG